MRNIEAGGAEGTQLAPSYENVAALALDGAVIGPFQKPWSSYNGNCVEVAALGEGAFGVRDSKDPDGPVLVFGAEVREAFVADVRAGNYDL